MHRFLGGNPSSPFVRMELAKQTNLELYVYNGAGSFSLISIGVANQYIKYLSSFNDELARR